VVTSSAITVCGVQGVMKMHDITGVSYHFSLFKCQTSLRNPVETRRER